MSSPSPVMGRGGRSPSPHVARSPVRSPLSASSDHGEALRPRSALKSPSNSRPTSSLAGGRSGPGTASAAGSDGTRPGTTDKLSRPKHVVFPTLEGARANSGSASRPGTGFDRISSGGSEVRFVDRVGTPGSAVHLFDNAQTPSGSRRGTAATPGSSGGRRSRPGSRGAVSHLFQFGVEDFVRAQDAKMGVDPKYLQSLPPMGTPGSSRPGSSAGSTTLAAKPRRPNSRLGSRAGTPQSGGKPGTASSKEEHRETEYEKAKREMAERVAKEEARKKEQQAKLLGPPPCPACRTSATTLP